MTYALLALAALFVIAIRLPLLDIPFERDEGGFAYIAQMLLRGERLYTDVADIKLPGLYYTYAAIMSVFGFTVKGVHIGLLLFHLLGMAALFLATRKVFNEIVALVAVLSYAMLALSPNLLGFAAHATQLLVPPALFGIYALLLGIEKKHWAWFLLSGLLLGYAFTIKQQAVYFMLFAGLFLLYKHFLSNNRRFNLRAIAPQMGALVLGSVLPYLITIVMMASSGRFADFWFWTFEWPREFGTNKGSGEMWGLFQFMFQRVTAGQSLLWWLAALGTIATFFAPFGKSQKAFTIGLTILLFAGVCTGFHFYQHYFVMMLPAICILIGILIYFIYNLLYQKFRQGWMLLIPLLLFVFAWAQIIPNQKNYFKKPDYNQILRNIYGANPFPESVEIAKYLKTQAKPNDEMVIFGSEPQIAFYANMRNVGGMPFIYPLVDGGVHNQQLQDDFMTAVEKEKPRFLLFVQSRASWLARTDRLEQWMRKHVTEHYLPIGMVDVFGGDTPTHYAWGKEQAMAYKIQSETGVYVFERKD